MWITTPFIHFSNQLYFFIDIRKYCKEVESFAKVILSPIHCAYIIQGVLFLTLQQLSFLLNHLRIFQISKCTIRSLKECIYSSLLSLGLALNLFRVFGDFASDGDVPCIGGNSPSSSSKKHCFGGVSVAIAISWNFSDSANKGKY